MTQAGIEPQLAGLPDDVKCAVREGENERYVFFYNFSEQEEIVTLPCRAYDLWNDCGIDSALTLAPRGSTVLAMPPS